MTSCPRTGLVCTACDRPCETYELSNGSYPELRGYFCAGDMKVAWYMQPNWLFRWAAWMAGWRWEKI